MDIEDLSKTQIVLLTLLVSFVTSIATGIVTVSLLDQAPPGVTQTVHKVVERTVERVVPRSGQTAGAGESVKEVTTVVKEHDLITESIEKNIQSLVRIYAGTSTSTDALGTFTGLGVVVAEDGLVATDRAVLTKAGSYVLAFADGTIVPAVYANAASVDRIALMQPDSTAEQSFRSAAFAGMGGVKLGQSVITLSGQQRDNVANGIITGLEVGEQSTTTEAAPITRIETDIPTRDALPGSPLVNIFNEVVGIGFTGGVSGEEMTFLPASNIQDAIETYETAQAAAEESTETDI